MVRLTGILTGAALAVTAIIVMVGVPELARPVDGSASAPVPIPATDAPVPRVAPQTVETGPSGSASTANGQSPDHVDVSDTGSPVQSVFNDDTHDESGPRGEALDAPGVMALGVAAPAAQSPYWHAFWSPFRSELAADGFISELQRTTGLDYRVVRLKPGVYEVAFAYSDDTDRQDKLERISAATGLDLSGG